jgi:DNA polymerase III subunit beta
MRLLISTDILQRKLSFLNHAVSNKSQLPVLQNILLEAKNNTVTLSSTDLEIGIETICQVEVQEEGGITVPTKQFTELIHSLPVETVSLETKDLSLLVKSKKTRSTFQTISQEEFPKLYEEKGILIAKMKTETLLHDIASVVFAASQDNTKPALSGILVKQEKEGFLLVATDGYRLSLKRHTVAAALNEEVETDAAMIIPARIFKELLAIKDGTDEIALFISKGSNQVVFECGETLLIGRMKK